MSLSTEEIVRRLVIDQRASDHIAEVIPQGKGRETLWAKCIANLYTHALGGQMDTAYMNARLAEFQWVETVWAERDAAIANETPADDVTFTAWPGG